MTPQQFIDKYTPCTEGADEALKHSTMSEAWETCERPDWLFWTLRKVRPLTQTEAVTLAISFAESCAKLNSDPRVGAAIQVAKAWLVNPCEETANAAAYAAANATRAARAAYATRAADAAADAAYAADAAGDAVTRLQQCQILRSLILNPFL